MRRLAIWTIAVCATVIGVLTPSAAFACGELGFIGGGCPPAVSNDGSEVTIGGSQTIGGAGGSDQGADGSSAGAGSTGGSASGLGPGSAATIPSVRVEPGAPVPVPPVCLTEFGYRCADNIRGGSVPPAAATPAAPVPASQPAVTLNDLASFRPEQALAGMEPAGWAVVGLPTNVYAQINQHVVAGTLLGQPADVRFTPYAYRWDYGDGTTARVGTRGGTWQSIGLAEFTPTATSHVYRIRGTYTITLTVEYTAEYRYAGRNWIPIAGVLTLRANDVQITAGSADTVLVARDCISLPRGPGC